MWDGEAFGKAIALEVAEAISRATGSLIERNAVLELRITELEAGQPARGEKGDPGVAGQAGANASDEQVAAAVDAWLKANPPAAGRDGSDGKDGRDGVDGMTGEPGEAGPPGLNTSDEQVAAAVEAWLGANPPAAGRDGKDGSKGDSGRDGVDGAAAPVVAGAIKDHTGELVLTLTDGTVLRTGIFDGAPGMNGQDGKDGEDGLGVEDIDVNLCPDERTMVVSFDRGDIRRSFELGFPVVLDRGVWKADGSYWKGDGVTWGGSFWIAQRDTSAKPETNDDWRLAVKRGRDGKDASK